MLALDARKAETAALGGLLLVPAAVVVKRDGW